MSRVDDDREAERLADRLKQEKTLKEARAKSNATQGSAFSKKVEQGQSFREMAERKGTQQDQAKAKEGEKAGRGLLQSVIAEAKSKKEEAAGQHQTRRGMSKAGEGERAGESRLKGRDADETALGRQDDAHHAEDRSETRRSDAKVDRGNLATREKDDGDAAAAHGSGGAAREQGDVKSDADGGGSQGGGKDDGKKGEAAAAASLRFNPALMAPVPVAQPRDMGASERLRQLANEIAQKIVERVRVGTNAAGQSEFQIDLRSNVLKGLSIKLSGGNGRIKATFSGNDREVLKLLRDQGENLKTALRGRGLTLEEFKVEERA